MARQTFRSYAWEQIERVLLAWEAVRLDPEYRKDWGENKKYVEWAESLPPVERQTIHVNDEKMCWLRKLGQKWDFDPGKLLVDPGMRIPWMNEMEIKKASRGRQKTFWRKLEQCPFVPAESEYIYLQYPMRAVLESQGRWEGSASERVDSKAREQGRIVFWVALGGSRVALRSQISESLDLQFSEAERDRKRVSRRGTLVQNAVRISYPDTDDGVVDFMVLSVAPQSSKPHVMKRIGGVLEKRALSSTFEKTARKLREGLEFYRLTRIQGKSFKRACVERFGGREWREHKNRQTAGEHSPKIKAARRWLSVAEDFVSNRKYKTLVRNAAVRWEELSPIEPPVFDSAVAPRPV